MPILLCALICDLESQCLKRPHPTLEESQSDPHIDLHSRLQRWNGGDSLLAGLQGWTDLCLKSSPTTYLLSGLEESLDLSKPGSIKQRWRDR